eukprot:jgi/Mesvir1/22663/Mv14095-RA.2
MTRGDLDEREIHFVPGLSNASGKFCWLNSALQALASAETITSYLSAVIALNDEADPAGHPRGLTATPGNGIPRSEILRSLQSLLRDLATPSREPRVLSAHPVAYALQSALAQTSPSRRAVFDLYAEQDASEALTHLLAHAEDEVLTIRDRWHAAHHLSLRSLLAEGGEDPRDVQGRSCCCHTRPEASLVRRGDVREQGPPKGWDATSRREGEARGQGEGDHADNEGGRDTCGRSGVPSLRLHGDATAQAYAFPAAAAGHLHGAAAAGQESTASDGRTSTAQSPPLSSPSSARDSPSPQQSDVGQGWEAGWQKTGASADAACRAPRVPHGDAAGGPGVVDPLPWLGYSVSLLICMSCGHKFTLQLSPFCQLSLSPPESVTQATAETWVHLRRRVRDCPIPDSCRCKQAVQSAGATWHPCLRRAQKRLLIAKAPEVLCLSLNRAVATYSGIRKIEDHVAFPQRLSVAEFTLGSALKLHRREGATLVDPGGAAREDGVRGGVCSASTECYRDRPRAHAAGENATLGDEASHGDHPVAGGSNNPVAGGGDQLHAEAGTCADRSRPPDGFARQTPLCAAVHPQPAIGCERQMGAGSDIRQGSGPARVGHQPSQPSSPSLPVTEESKCGPHEYQLAAVIVHLGAIGGAGGHWIAYRRSNATVTPSNGSLDRVAEWAVQAASWQPRGKASLLEDDAASADTASSGVGVMDAECAHGPLDNGQGEQIELGHGIGMHSQQEPGHLTKTRQNCTEKSPSTCEDASCKKCRGADNPKVMRQPAGACVPAGGLGVRAAQESGVPFFPASSGATIMPTIACHVSSGRGLQQLLHPEPIGTPGCAFSSWTKAGSGASGHRPASAREAVWFMVSDKYVQVVTWEQVAAVQASLLLYSR